MTINNATIHIYPDSPCIAKAGINFRNGSKIIWRGVMLDELNARRWIDRTYPGIPVRVFTHYGLDG